MLKKFFTTWGCFALLATIVVAAGSGTPPARAGSYYDQGDQPAPEIENSAQDAMLRAVKFDQKLGSQVPMDAVFHDEKGKQVALGSYFNDKPVILVAVYFHCTMLCSEVLKETVESAKGLPFTAGQQYNVVALSIDPRETPKIATDEKAEQLAGLDKAAAANGWHFLTGDKTQIRRVTNAIGFHFAYNAKTDEFAHPNGIVILTPHGKVTRYFYGLTYRPRDVKFALMEASENKIGSPVDQLLLTCFHFDPKSGSYDLVVMKVVRLCGLLTVLLLCGGVGIALRREKKHRSNEL